MNENPPSEQIDDEPCSAGATQTWRRQCGENGNYGQPFWSDDAVDPAAAAAATPVDGNTTKKPCGGCKCGKLTDDLYKSIVEKLSEDFTLVPKK